MSALVAGYAALFDARDLAGDVVRRGAFAGARAPLPMLLEHQGAAIGVWERLSEDPRGLLVRGRLFAANAAALLAQLRRGAVSGLSIGFRVRRAVARADGGRDLLALDLVEVSLVGRPMQPRARFEIIRERMNALAA